MRYLRAGGLPDFKVPNLKNSRREVPTFQQAWSRWLDDPLPTWDDIKWIRSIWSGPLIIKGICSSEDAMHAIDSGADALLVSNHGGNNIDGTPATLRLLPSIVAAVDNHAVVWVDGGVRRGADVVKALALGASAAGIGRAWVYAMAANGELGVSQVLDILRAGMRETLAGLGHSSVSEISAADLFVPDGFVIS
jgi:isopentenyl diphosphate isomerase/L-lactate dehydrogenase-like FMN-dependent dehydrogenase